MIVMLEAGTVWVLLGVAQAAAAATNHIDRTDIAARRAAWLAAGLAVVAPFTGIHIDDLGSSVAALSAIASMAALTYGSSSLVELEHVQWVRVAYGFAYTTLAGLVMTVGASWAENRVIFLVGVHVVLVAFPMAIFGRSVTLMQLSRTGAGRPLLLLATVAGCLTCFGALATLVCELMVELIHMDTMRGWLRFAAVGMVSTAVATMGLVAAGAEAAGAPQRFHWGVRSLIAWTAPVGLLLIVLDPLIAKRWLAPSGLWIPDMAALLTAVAVITVAAPTRRQGPTDGPMRLSQ